MSTGMWSCQRRIRKVRRPTSVVSSSHLHHHHHLIHRKDKPPKEIIWVVDVLPWVVDWLEWLISKKRFILIRSLAGKKIYRVKARMEIAPAKLIEHLKDTEKMCDWNTTLTEHKLLRVRKQKIENE